MYELTSHGKGTVKEKRRDWQAFALAVQGVLGAKADPVAEPGLIAAYLTELRHSASKLADVDDVVVEAEDHLLASVEAGISRGRSPA